MIANPTYLIVRKMIERGNQPGLIRELLETSLAWAEANGGQDATALRTWLAFVNFSRPFYTASELSYFWPALKLALGMETRMTEPPSPNRLSNELKFYGLPIIRRDWPRETVNITPENFGDWFEKNSMATEYFIVQEFGKWKNARLTQEELEYYL